MEYLWAHAMTPLPTLRAVPNRTNNSAKQHPPTTTVKRSRIPGHRRTTSASDDSSSARSRDSHEVPHSPNPSSSSASASRAHPAVAVLTKYPAAVAPPASHRKRVPASTKPDRHLSPCLHACRASHVPPSLDSGADSVFETFQKNSVVSSSNSSSRRNRQSGGGPHSSHSPANANTTTLDRDKSGSSHSSGGHPHHHAAMPPDSSARNKISGIAFGRAESVSSNSGATTLSSRTMMSSEPPSSAEGGSSSQHHLPKPVVTRNGRTYLSDPSIPYPLPVDLAELHRQSLRTLMLFQLFNGPLCSPAFANKPPTRVLEVGCGSGFWSMMCHRYCKQQGHTNISFTGMDVAPIGSGFDRKKADPGSRDEKQQQQQQQQNTGHDMRPDKDMKWRFVQHDMLKTPWPFQDGEFDLIMFKDVTLAVTNTKQQEITDEWLRCLKPGGVFECWESDYTLRMLRPHVPESSSSAAAAAAANADTDDEEDEHEAAARIGAYVLSPNTPLSAPLNNYIVEYNGWVQRALELRDLCPVPCTLMTPLLIQESADLMGIGSRRMAVPLSEVKWEREGVGGVVTKDGKSYIESGAAKGKGRGGKSLSPPQAALRRTALLTVVQMVQSLEPLLREVSSKSQDEWDAWSGKMMNDLVKENGTSWGECLEVGAWWAKKRK
ncbi:uncharacterized protein E0L32_009431 [Thyridium curvatum]|uniref:Uncharacterized protein n=1 Tax=Thyridium curvatum TaxID=1093900 RepID=A0A507APR2_9PEZI|nr:uncharacterized protein E0L32_009431 [Thyridium curvatum]TPX09387.1 hypothetical protein E0L32_009431 [Thyridium curvatum]